MRRRNIVVVDPPDMRPLLKHRLRDESIMALAVRRLSSLSKDVRSVETTLRLHSARSPGARPNAVVYERCG